MRSTRIGTGVLCALLGATAASGRWPARADAPEGWLKATRVAERVWRIDDHGADNMYLVEGKSRALLVDTGLGVARLADFVRTLTTLPVTVVNTPGHPDHAGGNDQFRSVYAPPLELDAIRAVGTRESRRQMLERTTK